MEFGRTPPKVQGRLPLLKESIEQVSELGHYLSDTHFDLVLSSDLPRAKKTTELIMESQKTKAKITYTKDLREWQLRETRGTKTFYHSSDLFQRNGCLSS